MQRRTFLTLCAGAAATSSGAVGAAAWLSPWVTVGQTGLFPGALLPVDVASGVPDDWALRVEVAHDGRRHAGPAIGVAAASGHVVVPYPFPDLQPGAYDVTVTLLRADGSEAERVAAGAYHLRTPVFSA